MRGQCDYVTPTNPVWGCRLIFLRAPARGSRGVANCGVPYRAFRRTRHAEDFEGGTGWHGIKPVMVGVIKLSRHSLSGAAESADAQRIGHLVEYAETSYPGAVSKPTDSRLTCWKGHHGGWQCSEPPQTDPPWVLIRWDCAWPREACAVGQRRLEEIQQMSQKRSGGQPGDQLLGIRGWRSRAEKRERPLGCKRCSESPDLRVGECFQQRR